MPTSAAPGVSLPRIAVASAANRASASGGEAVMGRGRIEEALQDDRGRERVHVGFLRGPRARFAQLRFGDGRTQCLVHEGDRQPVALAQAAGGIFRGGGGGLGGGRGRGGGG